MDDIRTALVNFRKHHDSNRWRASKSVFCGEPNDYECLVKLIGCQILYSWNLIDYNSSQALQDFEDKLVIDVKGDYFIRAIYQRKKND